MGEEIYVVGMAAVYAGARNLREFWETVLTRRQGFRIFPERRLPLAEYGSENGDERDKTCASRAGLIDGFEFDWKGRRVPKQVFETTDPAHWLALATAEAAVEDAGVDLDRFGRDRVGVVIGNSLTGEVSRANMLRLRWPYVRGAIAAAAARHGFSGAELAALLDEIEHGFKSPFPVPSEDTLAGALANVIAGRICNALDLHGGGYVVDGACASSLLAVSNACEALAGGRLDMAIAGGVDISLDPLEMVGFARTGALASGPMRVYDRDSAGFIPGEGCGLLVLTRGEFLARHRLRPWARLAGWGISSDGAGGITAPKGGTQALAMARCYERSGFGADTVDFIEGHGTGTVVGDREELLGMLEATRGAGAGALRPIGLTSVKTLLGHTKAAAGAAGLIKAVLAVNQRVLPPLAGFRTPAAAFAQPGARLYPIARGTCVPPARGLRAGVSGAGFGGINCHVAVSSEGIAPRPWPGRDPRELLASAQTAELFVSSADGTDDLLARIGDLLRRSAGMAEGELVDLAAAVALEDRAGALRAAVVAESVAELRARLEALASALRGGGDELPAAPPGTWLGRAKADLRIGYLIPGQGSQFLGMGSRLAHRSGWAAARRALWDARFGDLGPDGLSGFIDPPVERADHPGVLAGWNEALRETRVAQPAIVLTSLQWLHWLRRVGLAPSGVAGHSLGEIPALVAAGLLTEDEAAELVRIRAEACSGEGAEAGGMLALNCDVATAASLLAGLAGYAVVANDNAPDQVVVAGEPEALATVAAEALRLGIGAVTLNVSRAFHSRHMESAAAALANAARRYGGARTAALPFYSSVEGGPAPASFDPHAYLAGQITAPVRFRESVRALAAASDILVEVGPGSVLAGLAARALGDAMPVCALEPGPGDTDARFCAAVGRLYVAGAPFDWAAFYRDRYFRPFVPAAERIFIENPCARGNRLDPPLAAAIARAAPSGVVSATAEPAEDDGADASIEDIIRRLVARETGYDLDMISPEARLSRDLNLDSIKVAEVRAELRTRRIELPADLALESTPIREIAAAASRWSIPRGAAGEIGAAPDLEAAGGLPGNLPVLGLAREWPATALPRAVAVAPVAILHDPSRAEEAGRLVAELTAAGAAARLIEPAAGADAARGTRLVALPGDRSDPSAVSDFFARLGALAAAAESLLLATREALAPVFGYAQSLSLEWPRLPILAVEADPAVSLAGVALARIEPGAGVLRAGADGTFRRLALAQFEPAAATGIPLRTGDVVAVSGGAKGITAECTLALLRATGARALLLGTSAEETPGAEVEASLRRFAAAGLEAIYLRCDVADSASVRAAFRRGAEHFGAATVAGVIHGAGINRPALAAGLDPAALRREYAVKVLGLRNLLAAADPAGLKLCVALGSVIAAVGMRGNAGYALANEAMAADLAEFARARPAIRAVCIEYGVWSDVGMGAKLNVLESLERQHIAAITPEQGCRWFLDCCGRAGGPLAPVVAVPMHSLPTWRRARGTEAPTELPYTAGRIVHEPGVVLVSRTAINPARDAWLADHAFRGAHLFATVEALAAMAGGARLLAGHGVVRRFLDLRIARPIVASQRGDTAIELDVRRDGGQWLGGVGVPGAAFADPAFAARLELGEPPPAPPAGEDGGGDRFRPVPEDAGRRLYDHLLFQGPTFQRIEALLGLDLGDAVRRRGRFRLRREPSGPGAPIPDTGFLDALLQTVQVLVPRDLCLPVGIAEIVFHPAAWEGGPVLANAEITERTATGYVTRVVARSAADGTPVARFEGYRVNIVEHQPARPDADALFDALAADRAALAEQLARWPDCAGLEISLGRVDDRGREARRAAAMAQLEGHALDWRESGAPFLPERPDRGVAIAHDAGRLLTAVGAGRLGCDLQRVGAGRDWNELLPESRAPLWRSLTGALNDRDRAGAIVWTIHEALVKAGAADLGAAFVGLADGAPVFRLAGGGRIVAGVAEFALAGPVAVAFAQLPGDAEARLPMHYCRDIEMTFKEVLPPLKSPTAAVFFAWMGELREEAMAGIRAPLAHAFGQEGKAMVTNGTRVRIARPLPFHTPLRAWVWLERVLERQPSTFELGFQWAELGPDGAPREIVAEGLQRLTWVGIGPCGRPLPEPYPAFFAEFIAARRPAPGALPFAPPLGRLGRDAPADQPLWRRAADGAGEHGGARLWLETDETHSNFVGNIYFSHAATLVERTCRNALKQLGTPGGGFFATTLQLDHLGEAMPGDLLQAEVQLTEVRGGSCAFELALYNRSHGDLKIASGLARYGLFLPNPAGAGTAFSGPQPMPRWLLPHLAEEIS